MRGLFLSFSRSSPILLVGLLALSTHLLWAQRTSPLAESTVQLPDAPHVYLTSKKLPLSFEQNLGRPESGMRFFPDHTGYYRLPINTNAVLGQDIRTAEFWGKNRYFIGSAPPKWITFAPDYSHVNHATIHGANDLEHYGHYIPWASPVILRIGRQARAHPHVTRVVKMVQPQF